VLQFLFICSSETNYGKEQDLYNKSKAIKKKSHQTLFVQNLHTHNQLLKCNSLADLQLLGRNNKKEQNQQ
jgi:hypothetical protein